jgi:hypothetical protein
MSSWGKPPKEEKRKTPGEKWTRDDVAALVQFVALYSDFPSVSGSAWPSMSAENAYWEDAAAYVASATSTAKRKRK